MSLCGLLSKERLGVRYAVKDGKEMGNDQVVDVASSTTRIHWSFSGALQY